MVEQVKVKVRGTRFFKLFPLGLALGLLWPMATVAQGVPCGDLPETKAQIFFELSIQAVEDYQAKNYESAITKTRKAMSICDEDPGVEYNLGKAYQMAGYCPMALHHFTRLAELKLRDRDFNKRIQRALDETRGECSDAVPFEVLCEDGGVLFTIGDMENLPCPFVGRLLPGSYDISAKKAKYFPFEAMVSLSGPDTVYIDIPALRSLDSVGYLAVQCPEGVSAFTLAGNGTSEVHACPWEGEVEVGTYLIAIDGVDEPLSVQVASQEWTTYAIQPIGGGAASCGCQVRQPAAAWPLGALALALGLVGLTVLRRRVG